MWRSTRPARPWCPGGIGRLTGSSALPANTALRTLACRSYMSKAGHTVRIDDVSADPRTADEHIAAEFIRTGKQATIIVPLIKDDRFAACLYVHQAEPRHWRDVDVKLTEDVAERTWTAVLR